MNNFLMPQNNQISNGFWGNQNTDVSYGYAPSGVGAGPYYMPVNTQYSYQAQPATDIHWVQGLAGAKAYHVGPNQTVMLVDSEANKFYVKSTDSSGMPLPLRCFRYAEETEEIEKQSSGAVDMSQYLTKDEMIRLIDERLGKKDGK